MDMYDLSMVWVFGLYMYHLTMVWVLDVYMYDLVHGGHVYTYTHAHTNAHLQVKPPVRDENQGVKALRIELGRGAA